MQQCCRLSPHRLSHHVAPIQTFGGGCVRLLDPRLSPLHHAVPLQTFIALPHSPDVVLLQRRRRMTKPDGPTFGRRCGRSHLGPDGPPLCRNRLAAHRRHPPQNVWRGVRQRSPATTTICACPCWTRALKSEAGQKIGEKGRVVKID